MKIRSLVAALALVAGAFPALASETTVPLSARTGVEVTVYPGDLALVKDRRAVDLPAGESALAFEGVSAQLRPETALLRPVSTLPLFRVVEQVFDRNLINQGNILKRSLGAEVMFKLGEDGVGSGKLISVEDDPVVQSAQGHIHAVFPGDVIVLKLPDGLRAKPTLVTRVDSPKGGKGDLELGYLSGGLGWKADYVAQLSKDGKSLDVEAWATVNNRSGAAYENATLKLVAGEVNRVGGPRPEPKMAMAAEARMAPMAMDGGVREETLAAFHLYAIGRPTTLGENQSKQLSLLSASGVKATSEWEVSAGGAYHGAAGRKQEGNAMAWVAFVNEAASGLGLPLPAGKVRVYQKDSAGSAQFVGEDRMNHKAEGARVRLRLGKAFDIPFERVQTDFTRLSKRVTETSHAVTIKNGGDEAREVILIEHLPGEWEIREESLKHVKVSARRVEWRVHVPAKGETKVTWRARVEF